jgi:hypothetical protein
MVRHDMQKEKQRFSSEQIRLSLGILTPAEQLAQQKAEDERSARKAKEAAKGQPLFGEGHHG